MSYISLKETRHWGQVISNQLMCLKDRIQNIIYIFPIQRVPKLSCNIYNNRGIKNTNPQGNS